LFAQKQEEQDMPRKPKTPCRYPGCPRLVEGGSYCEEHKKEITRQYNTYERDKVAQRFYQSEEWKATRRRKLQITPLCEECMRLGKLTKATMVDHIKPIKEGGSPLDQDNLQSLCWSCHSRKSAQEGSRWGK
jgi:5-methylcytosine-specific restriction protein A